MKHRSNSIKPFRAAATECILTGLLAAALCFSGCIRASAYHVGSPGVIVIDPGHGGIDGGTSRDGLLEKDVNLSLALKLRAVLESKGYAIVMTRDKDIALDHLNQSSGSRHKRDLIARAGIIRGSAAEIFISLHVNSLAGDPSENGSIVYYGRQFPQSRALADFMQKELNGLKVNGTARKQQNPLANRYYILSRSETPGVLVETAFITNGRERQALQTEAFLDALAAAIGEGADRFLKSELRQGGAADAIYRRGI